jgi:hypothetical protein
MLKEFVNKLIELAAPTTYEINGHTYASQDLERIDPPKYMPKSIDVTGLDSVCKLVRNEVKVVGRKIFVHIQGFNSVRVFSTYDDQYERSYLYRCLADTPSVTVGRFNPYENAVIELRSLYIPNEDSAYLLKLLGSITSESKVTSSDNGVTQAVEAKSGIALSQMVEVKPRVSLKPFRTFIEVDQPESEFLLRISGDGKIGLFEADGGVWKLEATRNVAAYFEEDLKDLIENGDVVVIR